ncbi:MAG: hypothetical protein Q4E32_10775 [Bacteroidales bacterium]|nr:hypothetical protein [Bacteroidales bacterium]
MENITTQPTEHVDVQREAVEPTAVEEQKKFSSDKKAQDKQTFRNPTDLPFDACRPAFNKQSMLFLCGTTGGTSNWNIFVAILSRMTLVETVDTSSGRKVELKVCQANCSLSQLEKEWGISRKLLRKTFDQMEVLGLIQRVQSREASIVSFTSIWACEQLQPTFRRTSNPLFKSPTVPKQVKPSVKAPEPPKSESKPADNVVQGNTPADGK